MDEVTEYEFLAGEMNTLDFSKYSNNKLWLSINNVQLIIYHIGSQYQVKVVFWGEDSYSDHFNIVTADGKQIAASQIRQLFDYMYIFDTAHGIRCHDYENQADLLLSPNMVSQRQQFTQQTHVSSIWD